MKIPIKITPDHIRDSIVQVFFESEIPYIPSIGYFHSYLLKMGYDYTSSQIKQSKSNEIDLSFLNHLFVSNSKGIKLNVHPNGSLIFNCISSYPGWSIYSAEIERVIAKLIEVGLIKSVTRIGVRYTSEFPDINILENINFTCTTNITEEKILNGKFNLEIQDNECRVILNIVSNAPVVPFVNNTGNSISLIDIDVIIESFKLSVMQEIMKVINNLHQKQKENFFALLKEDFLETLNPIYE